MRLLRFCVAFAASALVAGPAAGQSYPDKPISLVVPFSPGGISDSIARPLAMAMTNAIGQPVVVLNKVGAGGAVGNAYAAKAAPDGYTLLFTLPTLSSIPASDKVNGRAPLYSTDQLEAIARITADPVAFFVRADSKWKSLKQLIADAKAKPGTLSFASAGVYSVSHIAGERLSRAAGIELLHVPYKGGGELITAVLAGQTNGGIQTFGTLSQHIRSGKLRALVVQTRGERIDGLPDVPSTKELGLDNADYYVWTGIFAPVGVPEAAKKKLRAAVRASIKDPALLATLRGAGSTLQYLDAPEFQKFWRDDEKQQVQLVTGLGKL